MSYEFDIVPVTPVVLAVTAPTPVRQDEVPTRITAMFDVVYGWLPTADVAQTGHNYAIYRPASEAMTMQVGFPVSARFEDGDAVKCLEFGSGKAAHTAHHGEYGGIPLAYTQLHAWIDGQSLERAGLSWEVYGDWFDDPAKLVTDIYVQLA